VVALATEDSGSAVDLLEKDDVGEFVGKGQRAEAHGRPCLGLQIAGESSGPSDGKAGHRPSVPELGEEGSHLGRSAQWGPFMEDDEAVPLLQPGHEKGTIWGSSSFAFGQGDDFKAHQGAEAAMVVLGGVLPKGFFDAANGENGDGVHGHGLERMAAYGKGCKCGMGADGGGHEGRHPKRDGYHRGAGTWS